MKRSLQTLTSQIGYIEILNCQYPYIQSFVIYKRFRGKGLARELAKRLPKKCWLYALPMSKRKNGLDEVKLINFYKSLGFKLKVKTKMNEMYRR